MEAIRSLMRGDLPPAGNAIVTDLDSPAKSLPDFPGYRKYWLDSGTSALALALIGAKERNRAIKQPEVIIPAYCCPDLVAAAVYAGVKPVVVDTAPNDSALDPEGVQKAVSDQTIGIIAVTFLGIRENLDALTQCLSSRPNVMIIEDNAQWFPQPDEQSTLRGDFVVFSFGRGKPLSLLGGGLLLVKNELPALEEVSVAKKESAFRLRLKVRAYNHLLTPQLYQILNRNPIFKLGQTRYHALENILEMDAERTQLLPVNYHKFSHAKSDAEMFYDNIFADLPNLNTLTSIHSTRRYRLLRYPVLIPSIQQREFLVDLLSKQGLGNTAMYQKKLIDIDHMQDKTTCVGPLDNANSFAERLITLPVHEGVHNRHLHDIACCLRNCQNFTM